MRATGGRCERLESGPAGKRVLWEGAHRLRILSDGVVHGAKGGEVLAEGVGLVVEQRMHRLRSRGRRVFV